jgi:hypothetical protein
MFPYPSRQCYDNSALIVVTFGRIMLDMTAPTGTHGDQLVTRQTPYEALPELLTVMEFATAAGLGRTSAYEIARAIGIRFGDRVLRVPRSALRRPEMR